MINMLVSYQTAFLGEKAVRHKKKPKRRHTAAEEAPWVVKGQGQSALARIRVLDYHLISTLGVGLIAFACGAFYYFQSIGFTR